MSPIQQSNFELDEQRGFTGGAFAHVSASDVWSQVGGYDRDEAIYSQEVIAEREARAAYDQIALDDLAAFAA